MLLFLLLVVLGETWTRSRPSADDRLKTVSHVESGLVFVRIFMLLIIPGNMFRARSSASNQIAFSVAHSTLSIYNFSPTSHT